MIALVERVLVARDPVATFRGASPVGPSRARRVFAFRFHRCVDGVFRAGWLTCHEVRLGDGHWRTLAWSQQWPA